MEKNIQLRRCKLIHLSCDFKPIVSGIGDFCTIFLYVICLTFTKIAKMAVLVCIPIPHQNFKKTMKSSVHPLFHSWLPSGGKVFINPKTHDNGLVIRSDDNKHVTSINTGLEVPGICLPHVLLLIFNMVKKLGQELK